MEKINVLIDLPPHAQALDALKALPQLRVTTAEPAVEERPLPTDLLRDQEILFCEIPPSNLEEMTQLKLIQISSVGYDQLLGKSLTERGIRACNAQGVFDVPIAEWNIALMFQLIRDMPGMFVNQQNKVWDRAERFQTEMRGRKIGFWGYGGIGRETTRLAKAMGMHVRVLVRGGIKDRGHLYHVPGTGDLAGTLPDEVFAPAEIAAFMDDLDFLIVAVPLTNQTRGMIGAKELALLPRKAFLLNPARGPIIDEAALLDVLGNGKIAGAALDTHYHYPMPPEHPLWAMPNVIMTPHISGSSLSTHFSDRVWTIFSENVRRYLTAEPLLNQLSAQQLSGE